MGGDELAELGVEGPGVVDGGHAWCRGCGRERRRLHGRGRVRGRGGRRSRRWAGWRCSRCGWVAGSGIGRCSRGRRRGRRYRAGGRGPRCRPGRRRRCGPRRATRWVTRRPGRLGRSRQGAARASPWSGRNSTPWSSTAVDGADGAVDERGVAVAVAGVEQDPVAGLVAAVGRPAGPGDRGPGEGAGVGESAADAVGEVLGLGVGHDEGDRGLGAVADDVGGDGVGHRPPGVLRVWRRCVPSRGRGAAVVTRSGRRRSSRIEGVAVVGVDLAAVDGQPGGGDRSGVGAGCRSRRRSRRLSPTGPGAGRRGPTADRRGRRRPRRGRCGASRVEVWEISSRMTTVPAGSGPLVRSTRKLGDRAGRQAGGRRARRPPSPSSRRRGRAGHRRSRSRRRRGPSRSCRSRPERAPRAPIRPDRTTSTPPDADRHPGTRPHAAAQRRSSAAIECAGPSGEAVEEAEGVVLEATVGDGRPAGRFPPRGRLRSQPDNQIRRQEPVCESGDLDGGEPTSGQTGDVFDDVVFGEPGVMSAQARRPRRPDAGRPRRTRGHGVRGHASTPTLQLLPDSKADFGSFGLPPSEQHRRGGGVVLGRAGGEGGFVVGSHPQGRGLVAWRRSASSSASISTVRFENVRNAVAVEPGDLAGVAAIRLPLHAQPQAQQPLQLGLIHRPGGPGPHEHRPGGDRHTPAVLSPHDVRDQAVRVDLWVPGSRRAMHEPGHRPARRRHVAA